MIEAIRELMKFRDLLYMITWHDIRIKYKQSTVGILWAVFMPIVIFATFVDRMIQGSRDQIVRL